MTTHMQWQSGKARFYDGYETVLPLSPIVFYDDFLGTYLRKYVAGENTTALWKTTETVGSVALVANAVNGIAAPAITNADSTQIAALHFGDQLCFSLLQGLIFEARVTFSTLPTSGTGASSARWGLASAHNADIDTVGTNVWFGVESAANTTLLWETDNPGGTDDDDNTCAGITLAAATYNIYRIDTTDGLTAKFFVDGTLVGTGDISVSMSAADALVQPYFRVSKVQGGGNTATGVMNVDYVRIFQNRS